MFWKFKGKDPLKIYRALAYVIDYLLLFLVGEVVFSFLPFFIDLYLYLLYILIIPALWIPIEAILISCWGTTPGKSLFGISVKDKMGQILSFKSAFKRAFFFSRRPGIVRQIKLSFRRRMVALFIGAACAIACLFGNALTKWSMGIDSQMTTEGWIQYSCEDAGFSVHFPSDPREESKKLPIPSTDKTLNYQELTSHPSKGVYYSVSYIDLPRKWKLAGSSTLLKGALEAIVKHSPEKTELRDKKFTNHQNHRALDFSFKQGSNHVKGRLIIVGMTLYKLTIVYPPSLEKELANSPFLDSFDLSNN